MTGNPGGKARSFVMAGLDPAIASGTRPKLRLDKVHAEIREQSNYGPML
jgi:hypothetical protein